MAKGQQPGESDRDYIRRLSAESGRTQQIRKDAMRQDRLDFAAYVDREKRLDRASDADTDAFMRDFAGVSLEEIQREADKGTFDNDPRVQKAVKAVTAASKGSKRGRAKRMRKAVNANKSGLKKAGKITNANNGCAVMAVALLGIGGGALYGMYAAGSALVAALGH